MLVPFSLWSFSLVAMTKIHGKHTRGGDMTSQAYHFGKSMVPRALSNINKMASYLIFKPFTQEKRIRLACSFVTKDHIFGFNVDLC